MTNRDTRTSLVRGQMLLFGSLLVLSGAAWGILVWQAGEMSGGAALSMGMGDGTGISLTMGMGAALFMGMWVLMMIAMMFPTGAPMILTFASISKNRQGKGESFVPTWFFVTSYLLLWTAFGVVAYLVAIGANQLGERAMFLHDNGARIGGGLLVVAGVYQLSPLKKLCLTQCRTPLTFVLTSWREGYRGALEMGFRHGTYCLGCCWLVFVILLPLGVMNVAAMGVATLVIFAEKALPGGILLGRLAGAALAVFGVIVLFRPGLLPTTL